MLTKRIAAANETLTDPLESSPAGEAVLKKPPIKNPWERCFYSALYLAGLTATGMFMLEYFQGLYAGALWIKIALGISASLAVVALHLVLSKLFLTDSRHRQARSLAALLAFAQCSNKDRGVDANASLANIQANLVQIEILHWVLHTLNGRTVTLRANSPKEFFKSLSKWLSDEPDKPDVTGPDAPTDPNLKNPERNFDWRQTWLGRIPKKIRLEKIGTGSGLAITSDGYIVTAAHVLREVFNGNAFAQVRIGRHSFEVIPGSIKYIKDKDLALCQCCVSTRDFRPARILLPLEDDPYKKDTQVHIFGFREGTRYSTLGAITESSFNIAPEKTDEIKDAFKTNALGMRGFSGGVLANTAGEFIGVNIFGFFGALENKDQALAHIAGSKIRGVLDLIQYELSKESRVFFRR